MGQASQTFFEGDKLSCVHSYLIRSLQLSGIGNGGDMMTKVQKVTVGGIPFLDKKTVLEKGVKKIKILSEAELVDTEYEGKKSKKLECICSTQVLDPTQVKWQMNATTQNFLIDKWGDDTKSWIGKEIELAVKQAGSASPGIYPKDCSLEKVL